MKTKTEQEAGINLEMAILLWPRCVVPGCENRVCLRLSRCFCYRHGAVYDAPKTHGNVMEFAS